MRLAAAALALIFATASCTPPDQAGGAPAGAAPSPVAEPEPAAEQEPPRREARRAASAPSDASGGYQYIDESGRVRVAASLDEVPERQRSTVTALATARTRARRPAAQPDEPSDSVQRADVTIYTTPGCGWCRRAMAYFDQKGIDYTNRDVSSDAEAYADYEALTAGRSGVPVIVVGEDWMQGWNQNRFDELLASAN